MHGEQLPTVELAPLDDPRSHDSGASDIRSRRREAGAAGLSLPWGMAHWVWQDPVGSRLRDLPLFHVEHAVRSAEQVGLGMEGRQYKL